MCARVSVRVFLPAFRERKSSRYILVLPIRACGVGYRWFRASRLYTFVFVRVHGCAFAVCLSVCAMECG